MKRFALISPVWNVFCKVESVLAILNNLMHFIKKCEQNGVHRYTKILGQNLSQIRFTRPPDLLGLKTFPGEAR